MRLAIVAMMMIGALVPGCLAPGEEGTGYLDRYAGCQLLFPSGEPDPCADDVLYVDPAGGAPGPGWVCIWDLSFHKLYWNPVLDEHAFRIEVPEGRHPELTWLRVWSSTNERTWVAEKPGLDYWWSIGHWPDEHVELSFLSTRTELETNETTLQDADVEYLWSERGGRPWLNIRFITPESNHTFSANPESPYTPGLFSAGSFYLEEPEFFISFRLPHFASGSVGEVPNIRLPRCV